MHDWWRIVPLLNKDARFTLFTLVSWNLPQHDESHGLAQRVIPALLYGTIFLL
jgi:hypothetical protein